MTLTPRQLQLMECLERGLSNAEIAKEIGRHKRFTEVQIVLLIQLFEVLTRSELLSTWRTHREPEHPERVHLTADAWR